MSRGKLFFTVGLPRSGKSRWCDDWVRQSIVNPLWDLPDGPVAEPKRPGVIVCGDDFRHAVHGGEYRVEAEGTVFAAMDVAVRALLRRGFDVIIDETCTTEATLLRYLRIDPDATPVFIDTPEEECLRRAFEEDREYLAGPIRRMAGQLRKLREDWDATVARLRRYVLMREVHDVPV